MIDNIYLTEQQFRILVECSPEGFWLRDPNKKFNEFELFDKKLGVNCDYISRMYGRYYKICVNKYDQVVGESATDRRKLPISHIDTIRGIYESTQELLKFGRP